MMKEMLNSVKNLRNFYYKCAHRNLTKVNVMCSGNGTVLEEIVALYNEDPEKAKKLFDAVIQSQRYHGKIDVIDEIFGDDILK